MRIMLSFATQTIDVNTSGIKSGPAGGAEILIHPENASESDKLERLLVDIKTNAGDVVRSGKCSQGCYLVIPLIAIPKVSISLRQSLFRYF